MINNYPENVAEHTLMCAVLAHALALIGRDMLKISDINPDECAAAALFHDAPEIITGDLPTPVKYFDPEIREAYRRVEDSGVKKLLGMLPQELRSAYAPLMDQSGLDPQVERYVHAADKLSALIKCKEELRAGNTEFADAARQTEIKLEKLEMPEINYFLEHFMPSFELTLDKLQ